MELAQLVFLVIICLILYVIFVTKVVKNAKIHLLNVPNAQAGNIWTNINNANFVIKHAKHALIHPLTAYLVKQKDI